MDSPDTSPSHESSRFDAECFPHILERIIQCCTPQVQHGLRLVSRQVKSIVDRALMRHIVLSTSVYPSDKWVSYGRDILLARETPGLRISNRAPSHLVGRHRLYRIPALQQWCSAEKCDYGSEEYDYNDRSMRGIVARPVDDDSHDSENLFQNTTAVDIVGILLLNDLSKVTRLLSRLHTVRYIWTRLGLSECTVYAPHVYHQTLLDPRLWDDGGHMKVEGPIPDNVKRLFIDVMLTNAEQDLGRSQVSIRKLPITIRRVVLSFRPTPFLDPPDGGWVHKTARFPFGIFRDLIYSMARLIADTEWVFVDTHAIDGAILGLEPGIVPPTVLKDFLVEGILEVISLRNRVANGAALNDEPVQDDISADDWSAPPLELSEKSRFDKHFSSDENYNPIDWPATHVWELATKNIHVITRERYRAIALPSEYDLEFGCREDLRR